MSMYKLLFIIFIHMNMQSFVFNNFEIKLPLSVVCGVCGWVIYYKIRVIWLNVLLQLFCIV